MGESGSGKSTLGRMALRLIEPTGGSVVLAGKELGELSAAERWEHHTGQSAASLHWHLVFTAFRLGVIRMRLRRMMVAAGLLPAAEARPDARNESIQLLAVWLGETPPGSPLPRKPAITLP